MCQFIVFCCVKKILVSLYSWSKLSFELDVALGYALEKYLFLDLHSGLKAIKLDVQP